MYPITISVLGTVEFPVYLKFSIYDTDEMQEKSLIYTIEEHSWRSYQEIDLNQSVNSQQKKKRAKKYDEEFNSSKNYQLEYFLLQWGYELIINSINIKNSAETQSIELSFFSSKQPNKCIDRLEGTLSIQQFIKSNRQIAPYLSQSYHYQQSSQQQNQQ